MSARGFGWLLSLVLLAGLVSAAPAAAEDPAPPGLSATDRGKVVESWQGGGPAVKAAAEAALIATGEEGIHDFLASGRAAAEYEDDKEAALQIVAQGGRGLRDAAQQALAGTPQDLAAFLDEGWRKPFEDDELIEATRIGDAGGAGRGLKEAASTALNGSVEQVKKFLNQDQYDLRDADDLVEVARLEGAGGPATKRAAAAVMNSSMDDVREFLLVGQFVARAHDQEYATIEQLVEQARVTGEQAEREAAAAKDASDRAIVAARLAKEAAERAAAELRAAQGDAARAIEASRRAAEATRRAADAAASAVSAARKAAAAARLANSTATSAASAAAGASEAAGRALKAASAGAVDAATIDKAAKYAQQTTIVADWANRVTFAASAVSQIADALKDLTGTLNAALAAADEAGTLAERSGVSAAETRAAAASARRYAAEATRASGVASTLASDAGKAAAQARDAARSASTHASDAAQAARAATSHAGDAAKATEQARIHSEAAKAAAAAANTALQQAVAVEQQARKADDEEVKTRTIAGRNHAEDLSAAYQQVQAETIHIQGEAQKLDQDASTLAARAAQPDANVDQVVADGRRMAVASLRGGGPWSSAAAAYALAGSDNAMADYARSGWRNARQSDERDQVYDLAVATPYSAVSAAAKITYKGDAGQVHAFLEAGQHDVAFTDYQVEASRIAQNGGPGVKQAATDALNAETPKALVDFLTVGQYKARETDDRVLAAQLAQSGGAEVKAAAEAALVSPPGVLRTFLESGQFQAQRQDQLTAAHLSQVAQAIAEAADIAAKARQNASEASRTYALARNANTEAGGYALQAQADAADAVKAAQEARKAADAAEASAKKAAEYAKTANQARQQATDSANQAADSAVRAESSATAAATSAGQAYATALAAQIVAEKAGKDAKTVNDIFQDALSQAKAAQRAAQYGPEWNSVMLSALPPYMRGILTFNHLPMDQKFQVAIELAHLELDLLSTLPIVGVPAGLANCVTYGMETQMGLSDGYMDAALSCASMVPLAGWGTLGAKLERWGVKTAKISEALEKLWKRVGAAPPCPTPNSFPAGTRVLMSDGTSRPIEELRIGDSVTATDPEAGTTAAQNVTATIRTPEDRDFTELTIGGPDGTSGTVTSTDHHRYWSQNRHSWLDAAALTIGDTVQTSTGQAARITVIRHWTSPQPAYNLTISTAHTYYVLAGTTPVLVHNEDCLTAMALGLSRTDDDPFLIDEFSDLVKAPYYKHWPVKNWENAIKEALKPTSTTKIHFNLTHIDDPAAWAKANEGVISPDGDYTGWELALIKAAPESVRKRVTWWLDGIKVVEPKW